MAHGPRLLIDQTTQLSIFLSNTPGALSRVCQELAEAEINIHALAVSDTADHAVVRMVVSDPTKALMLLGERGVLALESEVLMIECDNHEPGTLARIADKMADAKINIEYLYSATAIKSERGLMILRPSEVERALGLLREV